MTFRDYVYLQVTHTTLFRRALGIATSLKSNGVDT